MVEIEKPELEGEQVQYGGDTWELTGQLDVKRNGEAINAEARKTDRVRGNTGVLTFDIQDAPASINPGNPGDFTAELEPTDGDQYLVASRDHTTNHYKLKNLRYE